MRWLPSKRGSDRVYTCLVELPDETMTPSAYFGRSPRAVEFAEVTGRS